jgi:hypothetical protein
MKKIVGHLLTERQSDGTRQPHRRVRVGARLPGSLFDYKGRALAFAPTQDDGRFELSVLPSPVAGTRPLELVAYDKAGRELPFSAPDAASPRYLLTAERRAQIDDRSSEAEHDYGDFVINAADAAGLQATLGTGQRLRYSEGNRVRTLMDRDAFACAAAMMRAAQQEVLVSQLFFAIPEKFESSFFLEKQSLIFDFDQAPPLDPSCCTPSRCRCSCASRSASSCFPIS